MSEQAKASMWAIVELMGRQRIAGEVTEVTVAGAGFLRVDVPDTSIEPGFTRLIAPASIYAINPTTEVLARQAAEVFRPKPVQTWELPKALPQADAEPHNEALRPDDALGDNDSW